MKRWALPALLLALAFNPSWAQDTGTTPTPFNQALAEYQAENYSEALPHLQRVYHQDGDERALPYLALTYYRLLQYEQAQPLLRQALVQAPQNRELRYALSDVLLVLGNAEQALDLVHNDPDPRARSLAGRSAQALNRTNAAIHAYEQALDETDPRLFQATTLRLAPLYLQQNRADAAQQLVERAIALAPDSFDAAELGLLSARIPVAAKDTSWQFELGYRIEYDSNAPLLPDQQDLVPGIDDDSDYRNVLFADLQTQHSFGNGFRAYGEVHLRGGLYFDLNDLDFFDHNYVAGLGWDGNRFGIRLPFEFSQTVVDGESIVDSLSLAPGVYLLPNDDLYVYGFVRLSDNDFDEDTGPSEDRSGDLRSLGLSANWLFAEQRGHLRAIFEHGRNDTDGRNWERDETRVYVYGSYRFSEQLQFGLGYEYQHFDHDRVHDVFLVQRDDNVHSVFLSADYILNERWKLQFQALRSNSDSNIDLYSYDRNVFSAGFSWRY